MHLITARHLLVVLVAVPCACSAQASNLVLGLNEPIDSHRDAKSSDVDSIWTATQWLGACWTRAGLVWPEVEEHPGRYHVPPLIDSLIRSKPDDLRLLVVLGFENSNYTPSLPLNDSTRAAYRRYLDFVIGGYADVVDAWQVWNEPNIKGPRGTPPVTPAVIAEVTRLTRAARDSLDPTALLVGPAILGGDREWATAYHRTGADTLVDIVGVHYYPSGFGTGGSWSGFDGWIAFVRTLWQGRPIWITETGATTRSFPSQTEVLKRLLADAQRCGVSALFWWNLRDFTHGNTPDYTCGLYDTAWRPKPAAFAFRAAADSLRSGQGCRNAERAKTQ